MSEVILCYPKTGFDIKLFRSLPLSVLTVAAGLVEDFEVKIIDQRVENNWKKKLKKELYDSPICVGISTMTGSQIGYAIQMSKFVRENNEDVKIVWGGPHPTLLPIQTLESEFVDMVVIGEGDSVLRDISLSLDQGKPLDKIHGIGFKKNGKVVLTPVRKPEDLDSLPEIPYELVNMENYTNEKSMVSKFGKRALPFISSRGCPFKCAFCSVPSLHRSWRAMNPKRVSESVNNMVEKFNIDYVVFHDENFFTDLKRSKEIGKSINGEFRWSTQARIDSIKHLDLNKYQKFGLDLMQIGIESGSDRILKLMKKGVNVKEILNANEKLSKSEIEVRYNFMLGIPTETIEDVNETTNLALKLLEENPNARIAGFYVYVPYPGTDLYDLSLMNGFTPISKLGGWSTMSRQHQSNPWTERYRDNIENIVLTSRFVDKKRLSNVINLDIFDKFLQFYGSLCFQRWKRGDFGNKLDILIIKSLLKHVFKGVF